MCWALKIHKWPTNIFMMPLPVRSEMPAMLGPNDPGEVHTVVFTVYCRTMCCTLYTLLYTIHYTTAWTLFREVTFVNVHHVQKSIFVIEVCLWYIGFVHCTLYCLLYNVLYTVHFTVYSTMCCTLYTLLYTLYCAVH